ncbi:nucleoside recognition GATE domain-containing membrane protein YjiH [Alkalibacterium putridalgicola]|uniref:Membrane protein n=1 Tax=Alkalibacterium putridalgicola TaxID=426703 RepID=A0A1H7TLU7_9LACT|nr:nucleoside recognition domain-containing protein [Alkalibacterium putridalgicola]GEK88231.1 membrane protein [Alkalibacterium putridalgicola]SEL85316.1 nucleoside recognition GATE domain-containing membrane protein YjiH [Alkalibacterium putridalgicola]
MINKLKFIFLSLFGFVFFLVPFTIGGESKIMLSHIIDFVKNNILDEFLAFTAASAWIVLIGTVIFMFYTSKSKTLNNMFKASPLNVVLRITGSFLYLMVLNNWFASYDFASVILDPNTGGLMVGEGGLLTTLYITFFVGILALPLLTHFGIVEFIGILLGPVVEKLFRVPGYSMIDAIASFVGDGTIGIVVTDKQYQRGYYNKREAYIIATSFSVVGIAFAAAVADELGFGSIFPIFYGSILLVTLIIAFITARLPLKKFEPTYYEGKEPKSVEVPEDETVVEYAYDSAVEQAKDTKVLDAFIEAIKNIIHIYIGFLPIIMAVGTISLIIAEYTPFFDVISAPLVPLYEFIGYSTDVAAQMAPASLAGFADMYLPALFISGAESEAARFFIGVLAFTQLVFMSETGMILVETKIGLNFWDVIKVFLFRTILSIPLLYIITNILVAMNVLSF